MRKYGYVWVIEEWDNNWQTCEIQDICGFFTREKARKHLKKYKEYYNDEGKYRIIKYFVFE